MRPLRPEVAPKPKCPPLNAGYVNPSQLLPPRSPSGLPSGVEAWQRHCRRYYQAFDYRFTGFLINGRAGVIPPEAERMYLPFSLMES